jgi:hypothetical protein
MLAARSALLPALAVLAAACSGQDLAPASPGAPQPPEVAPTAAGEGTVRKIGAADRVPLEGPRVDAKPGDWLLENAGSVAVVSADGVLVDFGARGGRDEITGIDPRVYIGLDAAHAEVAGIEPVGGGHVLHVARRVLERPIVLHAFYGFQGDALRIETVAVTGAAAASVAITLGERVGWGNVMTWAEGQGYVTKGGTFSTDFVARDAYGAAYALCAENGRLLARFDWPDSGFFEPASTGETPELVAGHQPGLRPDKPGSAPGPVGGTSTRRVVHVVHAEGSVGKAALALPCRRWPVAARLRPPAGLPARARVEVARCTEGGRKDTPWARFLPAEGEIPLPDGCFEARLLAPGHAPSAWFQPADAPSRALQASGRVHFAVTTPDGKPLPARVVVRGIGGTADPDWWDDADQGAALNVVYAEKGEGERPVPPGRYKVTIDRGFEYTAVDREIEVEADKAASVRAELARVVDTKGWISADLHLHAMPSPDAPQPLADRVRALVATGVEVGVATDHNKVTDYRPVIAELGVGAYLASVVGDEITTKGVYYGHFNAFPLPSGAEPVPYTEIAPRQIFEAARKLGPLGPGTIVQVNHPRMGGIGYFDLLRFDREDVAGWARRVPLADMGFDAIEIFNGDHYALIHKVEECLRDWYALLDAGYRFTATGNSDSHRLSFHEPGVPRNLVAVPDDDPARFDERAFADAVRRGRVVVSSGPFIRFDVAGKGPGETVPPGDVDVSIVVDAPPWVDVDRVELVGRGGETLAEWTAASQAAAQATPGAQAGAAPQGAHRFEIRTTRTLRKGDWLVAVARGSRPMTYLYRPGARPFAFTNPVRAE